MHWLFALISISACLISLDAEARSGGGRSSGHASSIRSTGSIGHSHSVRSYTRRDGTLVQAHRATNRDHSKLNNWSVKGNVNPHTGKPGTKPVN